MAAPLWLHQVDLLAAPGAPAVRSDALIDGQGRLELWGEGVAARAEARGLAATEARGWLLAPPLVDPHCVLEHPWHGQEENLASLAAAAAAGGYGTVALLPWALPWRDRPERLQGMAWPEPLRLRLWGSFSLDGGDGELALHREQLEAGAIGLACAAQLPPLALLERGLLLGEMGQRPLLVAPRQEELSGGGFVREGVAALRAGWPLDPPLSETLPLQSLLTLAAARPERQLVLMNLSTAAAVELLAAAASPPPATVSWWHLVADAASLHPTAEGWHVRPSLGAPSDRLALIEGLRRGLITAVATHHLALDPEEQLLPVDQRRPGLAGHGAPGGLVLPCLWRELVGGHGWSAAELWQVLCWGPAALLGEASEGLQSGSRRWLLFDPEATASWTARDSLSRAANQPLLGAAVRGQVRATGLTAPESWHLPAPGCPSD
ncbi:MAG: dihydroorotase [Cyanobium sp. M30B3]|nr:MAG: dihydroorotase [Cyanobium sp. M30B3]